MPVHSESLKPMTNSSSAIERSSASRPSAGGRRDRHPDRAFGFAWPAASRAAASLSRMT